MTRDVTHCPSPMCPVHYCPSDSDEATLERISNHGQGCPTLSSTKSAETKGSWEARDAGVVQLGVLNKHDADERPVLDWLRVLVS
jgi:hypothetical protein